MSVIWSNERGWIVCHSLFLHKIYNRIENERLCSTCARYRVFHIDQPFLKRGQKSADPFNYDNDRVTNADRDRDDENYVGRLGNYSANDFKVNEV